MGVAPTRPLTRSFSPATLFSLILSCYDTTVNANELRQGNRVACLIGWDASIDCTTAIPWGPNPGGALSTNYWSAYSPNGCDVYMAGNGGYLANGGIQYTYRGQSGKSWPILAPTTSYNSVISVSSYGGQMYAMVGTGWSSSPPAMPRGVMLVGGKVSGPNVAAWTAIGAYPRVAGSTSLTFAPGLQTSCLDAQGNILPAGTPCVYGDACELSACARPRAA